MTREGNKAIVKIENKKVKTPVLNKDDFIKSIIVNIYMDYTQELFNEIEGYDPPIFDWQSIINHIDKNRKRGLDYWVCTVQCWGIPEEQAEFIGRFIHNDIHGNHQKKEDNHKSGLSLMDIETILSFACVMSYAYLKNPRFYDGAKSGLEDLLLSLSS